MIEKLEERIEELEAWVGALSELVERLDARTAGMIVMGPGPDRMPLDAEVEARGLDLAALIKNARSGE